MSKARKGSLKSRERTGARRESSDESAASVADRKRIYRELGLAPGGGINALRAFPLWNTERRHDAAELCYDFRNLCVDAPGKWVCTLRGDVALLQRHASYSPEFNAHGLIFALVHSGPDHGIHLAWNKARQSVPSDDPWAQPALAKMYAAVCDLFREPTIPYLAPLETFVDDEAECVKPGPWVEPMARLIEADADVLIAFNQITWPELKPAATAAPDPGAPAPPAVQLPPLSPKAAAVRKVLLGLPPDGAMPGPKLLRALGDQTPRVTLSESELTSRIVPELKPWGIENKPRVGYYIRQDARR